MAKCKVLMGSAVKGLTLSTPIPLRLYTLPWSNALVLISDGRRMSKFKRIGLDQFGAEPFEQQLFGTAGVEGVKPFRMSATRIDFFERLHRLLTRAASPRQRTLLTHWQALPKRHTYAKHMLPDLFIPLLRSVVPPENCAINIMREKFTPCTCSTNVCHCRQGGRVGSTDYHCLAYPHHPSSGLTQISAWRPAGHPAQSLTGETEWL